MPIFSDDWVYVDSIPDPRESEFYRCIIVCPERGINITANLPAEYQLDFGSSYDTPFSQSVSNNAYAGAKNTAGAFGFQFATKAMTSKIWQAGNQADFTIPLVLQIENDPYEDVIKPLADLYSLVLPSVSGVLGMLKAPGPVLDPDRISGKLWKAVTTGAGSLADAAKDTWDGKGVGDSVSDNLQGDPTAWLLAAVKNNCYLYIGHHQFFSSVVLTNVSQTTSVLPHYGTGVMSRVEVNVTFSTLWVPTQEDIKDLVLGSFRNTEEDSAAAVPDDPETEDPSEDPAFLEAADRALEVSESYHQEFLENEGIF